MSVVVDKNNELVSKRWAKALIDLTCEDEGISKEQVLEDLRNVSETIESSSELLEVLNNPSVSTEEKQVVICKLFENKVLSIVYNFLFALNLKKRINIIGQIAEEYEKELDKVKNIVHVDIISALDLSDERKEDIKAKISEKLNKDVDVEWGVDKDIIAGLIFNIDELIVDNSIRHKLEDLSKNIIKS